MSEEKIEETGDPHRDRPEQADPAFADSEYIKKKYFYRTLIVKGRARVKNNMTTRRLIGPDCAYHLYGSAYLDDDSGQDTGNSNNQLS